MSGPLRVSIVAALLSMLHGGSLWAAGSLDLSLLAGASVPVGSFGDVREAGPRLGGALDYQVATDLSLGFEAFWSRNDLRAAATHGDSVALRSLGSGSLTGLQFGLRAKVFLPGSTESRRFYLHGGAGLYDLSRGSESHDVTIGFIPSDSLRDSVRIVQRVPSGGFDLGGKVGTGVDLKVGERIRLGLEVEFDRVSGSRWFIGVHGALVAVLRPRQRSRAPAMAP